MRYSIATGLCFCVGILMAGSVGPWFPWTNWLGGGILALTVPLASRIGE